MRISCDLYLFTAPQALFRAHAEFVSVKMGDEQTDSLLDAALDTSKDDDSYVLDDTTGDDGDAGEDPV